MIVILIYLTFFTFYVDQVVGGFGVNIAIGLSIFNLCLYSLFFVWILQAVKRNRIFLNNNLNLCLLLLCSVVILSTFVKIFHAEIHVSVVREIISFKRWINPLLLFLILFNIIDDERTTNKILFGLAVFYFAIIITQILAIQGVIDYHAARIAERGRTGGLGAEGEYSVILSLFFPFVLSAAYFIKTSSLNKYFFSLLSIAMLMGYVNAGSRNGAVTLLAATFVFFLLIKRFHLVNVYRLLILMVALLGFGYVSFIVAPDFLQETVTSRFDRDQSKNLEKYSSGRTRVWLDGWEIFLEKPLVGHGKDTFKKLLKKRNLSERTYAAHNEYLKYLVEFGVLGFSIFLLIYLKIFQHVWHALDTTTHRARKFIYASYLAGLSGYMVGMFFTNTGVSIYIFWIYTAIVYKFIQLEESND